MDFNTIILPSAIKDIQQIIDYYDSVQFGLSEKFYDELNDYILSLQKNPYFQLRYSTVRCLPLKNFPVMIHFIVDEKLNNIYIRAVLNTHKDPESNWLK